MTNNRRVSKRKAVSLGSGLPDRGIEESLAPILPHEKCDWDSWVEVESEPVGVSVARTPVLVAINLPPDVRSRPSSATYFVNLASRTSRFRRYLALGNPFSKHSRQFPMSNLQYFTNPHPGNQFTASCSYTNIPRDIVTKTATTVHRTCGSQIRFHFPP